MSWKAAVGQPCLEDSVNPVRQWPSDSTAKPIHIQRIEKALDLEPLLSYIEALRKPKNQCADDVGEDCDFSANDIKCFRDSDGNKVYNGVVITRAERKSDKSRLYNFSRIKKTRKWLKTVLLSDTSSDEEEGEDEGVSSNASSLSTMLSEHLYRKRCLNQYQRDKELKQYQYYSVGLLSNYDKFYDHQKTVAGPKKKLYQEKKLEKKRFKEKLKKLKEESKGNDLKSEIKEEDLSEGEGGKATSQSHQTTGKAGKSKIKKLSPEQIAARRRKIWVLIAKKEIPRAHRHKTAYRKEVLAGVKKVAKECQKECRKGAILSQKMMKEATTRTRRLSKEMQAYWKRFEKVEKEHRRRAEKEALEQRKMDIELREMKRQQRKLNFLITQTELYAHFMARKLTGGTDVERDAILSSFDEEKLVKQHQVDGGMLKDVEDDEYDAEEMKSIALSNAEDAYKCHKNIKKSFDAEFRNRQRRLCESDSVFANPSITTSTDWPQPAMFEGKLKGYQLKGMNWLASLYDQGINGILADEMGLGKTVQSVAFLAHLAESQSIWGPFLVIAPASTLHNWQQEVTRFVPQFKVVPYWGNTQDRKTLRKFWNKKHIHMKEASFHIVITSYQLIVQDAKYFQQIEWHYMILDEAQAIKSSTSSRWKSLLVFKCRNRLLLTGTPIQNSMAELWALLHFIMPTLFDSHEEFNEWFSKDIENHVEKQSNLDKNQLGRLHMILKPFMLRRVKKDVENELSDKIEILYYCPLTLRQKMLYQAIKNKISIEDLLRSSSVTSASSQSTSSLMNLVMQFRKVCNHPELFERRDVKSPFHMKLPDYYRPKLLYREGFSTCGRLHASSAFMQNLYIFNPLHVHRTLFPNNGDASESRTPQSLLGCFSFTRLIDMSPAELQSFMVEGLLLRCLVLCKWMQRSHLLRLHHQVHHMASDSTRILGNKCLLLEQDLKVPTLCNSRDLRDLVFTGPGSRTYVHSNHLIRSAQGLRKRRSSKTQESDSLPSSHGNDSSPGDSPNEADSAIDRFDGQPEDGANNSSSCLDERCCVATDVPRFLYYIIPKVVAGSFGCYTVDRSAEWQRLREAINASAAGHKCLSYGFQALADEAMGSAGQTRLLPVTPVGMEDLASKHGFSNIFVPDKEMLVVDAGKLTVLDRLLTKLKKENHRVLIYSQMTRMIDILEEYLWYRKHTYMRLDGSSKISDRRDMVADFQTRSDIFVFLLSTRAGGLGINLTAADTVIFYDSDWNPTVDQQAMDRAHRLGQTKQVTVYRLICKGSIEERILQRAKEKSEIQRMVITGGNFSPDILKAKEVMSLLLDDDEMERKLQQKQDERKQKEEQNKEKDMQRKRKLSSTKPKSGRGPGRPPKRPRVEDPGGPAVAAPTVAENLTIPAGDESSQISLNSASAPPSPRSECLSVISEVTQQSESMADDESCDGVLVVDDVTDPLSSSSSVPATSVHSKRGGRPRGRPRGSGTTHRSRGRGSIQKSLSAAEAAAAVAAKKAAYAAYGYSFTDTPSPGSAHLGSSNLNYSSSLAVGVNKSTNSSTNGSGNVQL